MRFVVYEVWTRSYLVEAAHEDEVYGGDHEPVADQRGPLSLCNWHAVEVPDQAVAKDGAGPTPGRGRLTVARKPE